MSRWLQAAKTASSPNDKIDLNDKNAPAGIKSNKSILSERGRPEFPPSRLPALGSSRASVSPVDVEPVAVQKSDAELYADALRTHGPTSYGAVGVILGWGMARASRAETVLRNAGRIQYDNAGRGCLVEHLVLFQRPIAMAANDAVNSTFRLSNHSVHDAPLVALG